MISTILRITPLNQQKEHYEVKKRPGFSLLLNYIWKKKVSGAVIKVNYTKLT